MVKDTLDNGGGQVLAQLMSWVLLFELDCHITRRNQYLTKCIDPAYFSKIYFSTLVSTKIKAIVLTIQNHGRNTTPAEKGSIKLGHMIMVNRGTFFV